MIQNGCHLRVSVLLIIRNRPLLTSRILDVIRQARPTRLLVSADGPDTDQLCTETRRVVQDCVDWECDLLTRFSPKRAGCKKAVSDALNWAFDLCEELIVLEDDCLPNLSFFQFCEEMLHRYRMSAEVMQICGSNLTGFTPQHGSYYFSRFGPIWGWASWRRAWQHYDVEMRKWPATRDRGQLKELCDGMFERNWRRQVFDDTHDGRIDTWDYQWAFAKMLKGGINVIPTRNLISNLGFGEGATHTLNECDPRAALKTEMIDWPLAHPERIELSAKADQEYLNRVVGLPVANFSAHALKHLVGTWLH